MTLMDKANLARIGFREWLGGLGRLGKGLLIGALALCVAVPFGIIRGCKQGVAPPVVAVKKAPVKKAAPKKAPAAAPVKKSPVSKVTPTPRGVPASTPRFDVPEWRM